MRTCPACEEGTLHREELQDVDFSYRGAVYNVGKQTVWICDSCGEEITTAEELHRLQEKAKELHTAKMGEILSEKSDDRMYIRLPRKLKEEIAREARLHHRKPQQWVKWALVKKLQELSEKEPGA